MSLNRCPINFYLISAVTQTVNKTVEESKGTSEEKEMKTLEMLSWRKEDSRSDMRAAPNYQRSKKGRGNLPSVASGLKVSRRDNLAIVQEMISWSNYQQWKKLPWEKINSHAMAILKHRVFDGKYHQRMLSTEVGLNAKRPKITWL